MKYIYLITLALLFSVAARSQINSVGNFAYKEKADISEGLLRYYNLDNNLYDTSGNNQDASATDTIYAHRNGITDACFATDRNSRMDVPSIGNWGDHLVISFWFYGNAADYNQTLFGSRQNGSGATLTNLGCILQTDSTLRFFIASDAPDEPNTYSSGKIKPYQWNHVICIQNRETNKNFIILNGVADSVSYTQTPRYKNYPIGFGGWNSGFSTSGNFTGRIDEIRIYNRELSREELSYLFNQEFDVKAENDIMAEYKFMGNADDITGNGHDGTVQGAELTNDRFENAGNAYYFNTSENNYIDLGTDLQAENFPIFISTWINQDDLSGEQVIFRNDDWDTTSVLSGVIVRTIDGKISAAYGDAIGKTTSNYFEKNTDTVLEANTWYHLVVGFLDTENIAIYVNNEETPGTYAGTVTKLGYQSENGAFGIGSNETSKFSGTIDDVRIYNRFVDPSEISILYTLTDPYSPELNISQSELSFNDVNVGEVSNEKTFEISGNYLDGNVTLKTSEGFEISTTSGENFDTLLTITPEYATLGATTIYTRFAPNNITNYSGKISINSPNLSEMFINLSGNGISTGVKEFNKADVNIYPNPSNGNFNIELTSNPNTLIRVFDVCGRIVFNKSYENTDAIIRLSLNQKPGIYFVEIQINQKRDVKKIIIK